MDVMVTDHLGNKFDTVEQMAEFYKIPYELYLKREERKWNLKRKLTHVQTVVDHKGNKFDTVRDMLEFHNVEASSYYKRRMLNMTTEECLTTNRKVTDHLGNEFNSLKELADYHNISYTAISQRLRYQWNIEAAITTPIHENATRILDIQVNTQLLRNIMKYKNISMKELSQGMYYSYEVTRLKLNGRRILTQQDINRIKDIVGLNKQQMDEIFIKYKR